ncbi:OPT family oligopeptide transporter [Pseudobacteriovorax antillogorgiicola]|uniref:Putative oligopeptide transporter, OPT family n=1 Tax=Pseudobacteriovorax antillogorgiicola TaxID=1513793 RepID=A0A1Y6BI71_9BACT|nr:OPT family oligopeptide transporter [Pseudobacteriovorax antillogorgiicola]TCS56474.1 putative OPT family oligopeptide transporter [Pseudobacteriovorax antillogorgiicola]SMF05032.1 putative oligopeptide transporter, OPT family [Pseudobacteriovorax antillogorgiicola]
MNQTHDEQIYIPQEGESQLTFRAVAAGCLLGGIVTSMNLYLGLKIGWSIGGSLMAAILGFGLFALIKPKKPYSVLEANITQTAGSGAGSMASAAGLLAPIPAMGMLGEEIPTWGLFAWSLAIAYLGVMLAVPLRRQYVVIEKLRFPTGTATANTIVAMFASAGESLRKAKVLSYFSVGAFLYIVSSYFIPQLESPPFHKWFDISALGVMALWGFKLAVSPMLFGAGLLIGPRVGASLIGGAIAGWALLGPSIQSIGWAPHENPMVIFDQESKLWGVRGWILWVGVAIMVADGLVSLALSWKTFMTAFRGTRDAMSHGDLKETSQESTSIPNSWWMGGFALASIATTIVASLVFHIPPLLTVVAIFLSTILANVAVRSIGETDINPVGGMGKVTQAIFGSVSSSMATNLMSAGITGAGASQAGDMMQDLKTGHLLGASPKAQFKAQLIGILSGVFFAVPVYLVFDQAYDIGAANSPLTAPAAQAWKAVAEVMSKGFAALPPMAGWGMLAGFLLGGLFPAIKRFYPKLAPYTPSGLALGIAFIVPAKYSIIMFLGSLAYMIWQRWRPSSFEALVFAVSCGLIAGEGLAGITNAILTLIGVPSLF